VLEIKNLDFGTPNSEGNLTLCPLNDDHVNKIDLMKMEKDEKTKRRKREWVETMCLKRCTVDGICMNTVCGVCVCVAVIRYDVMRCDAV
jgi:hypothetical protein